MKKFNLLAIIGLLAFFAAAIFSGDVFASAGESLFSSKQYEAAADVFTAELQQNSANPKKTAYNLLMLGQSLDKALGEINTKAERECFRSGKGGSGGGGGKLCMMEFAEKLNAKYGPASFVYDEQQILLVYTGAQFRTILEKYPKSDVAAQADYLLLSKKLIGSPDAVLPQIKDFIERNKSGEFNRKGQLLWARINEDIWVIHRKWSWVLYNWSISPEELIVKAEPYRQEAIRSFEELIKAAPRSEEGKAAKKELELLKKYQDDGKIYGIINESLLTGK